MVTPNPNLIVEIQLGSHKNTHLWHTSTPFKFSHPYGWTLSCHADRFRLEKYGSQMAAVEFDLEQGRQGFVFKSGRPGDAILRVRTTGSRFQDWLEINPLGAGNGAELMVLRGNKSTLVRSTVATQSYECGQFSLRRSGNGWQLTALDRSVTVHQNQSQLEISSVTELPWGALETLTFTQGDTWWKFKRVATTELKFPAERFGAVVIQTAALILSVWAVLMVPDLFSNFSRNSAPESAPTSIESIPLVIKSNPKPMEVRETEPQPIAALSPQIRQEVLPAAPAPAAPKADTKPAPKTSSRQASVNREALKKALLEKRLQQSADLLKAQMKQFEQKSAVPVGAKQARWEEKRSKLLAGPVPFSIIQPDEVKRANQDHIHLKEDLTRAPSASSGISRPQSEESEVSQALKVATQSTVEVEEKSAYTIHGGLTQAQVEAAVVRQIDSIRTCYESALGRKSGLSGRMSLSFVIGKNGNVEAAKISESNIEDQLLQKCVVKRLAAWTFPTPSDSSPVNVSYPFLFKTVGIE